MSSSEVYGNPVNVNARLASRLEELRENVSELYGLEDDPDLRQRTVTTSLDAIREALSDVVRLIEAYRDGA